MLQHKLHILLLTCIFYCCSGLHAGQQYAIRHYSVEDGLSQNTVMTILQDRKGFMWFGTWDGLNKFDGNRFTIYKTTNENGITGYNNRIEHLYEDSLENLWWMTYDEHFYSLDPQRTKIREACRNDVPKAFFEEIDELQETLRKDKNGIIWQTTDEPGISRYRNNEWKKLIPKTDARFAGQLRKHFILLQDQMGRTWINPTGGGFGYYDAEKDEIIFPIPGITNMIHTAYFDQSGLLWLSTYDRGVDCINLRPQPFCLHNMGNETRTGEVRAMYENTDGQLVTFLKDESKIYCARPTSKGVLLGSKGSGIINSQKAQAYPDIHLSSNDIYDIETDEDETLYIATYGGGVNIIHHPEDELPLSQVVGDGLRVRDLIITDKAIWGATTSGLMYIDTANPTDIDYELIPWSDIRTLYYHDHRLWLGTFGNGLCYVDVDSLPYTIHPIAGPSAIVLAMCGSHDTLWYTGEKGITQMNLTSGEYSYIDAFENTSDYFCEAEAIRTSDGLIHFGYSAGYCTLDPNKFSHSTATPPLCITHIEQDENSFEAEYTALEYVGPNKIQYAYRLDGLDNSWHYVYGQKQVTYSNLKPGKYTFRVRSTNRDGKWVDNEQIYALQIDVPFYRSWWAICIYLILLAIIVLIIIYSLRTRTQLREKMMVEQKVTEIKLRFFTNISHELRTPLTLIIGPIDNILNSEHINSSIRQQLEIVQSNSQRMLRLVNQLLDFRKIQDKKMRLKVQRTLMSALIEEVVSNFNKEAYDKHIRLMVENHASDSTIWVDRERMFSILYNLLSNAFKFTPAGKTIRIQLNEKPGYLVLSVSDEGVGIPKERRNMLFERFSSHDDRMSTPDKPGTGIGLNLVKELVDLHSGIIEVESQVGVGTTFHILLHRGTEHFAGKTDVILTDDNEAARIEAKPAEINWKEINGQKHTMHTILIVEDNEDMRRFLGITLSEEYRIKNATDGKQALAVINEEQPDLVISDLMMPNMDGLELVQVLKSSIATSHIPIILLTAKTAIEDRLQGLSYGADDYITKPFDPDYLRVRISNIIQQREQLEISYRERLLRLEPKKIEEKENSDKFLAKLMEFMEEQMDNNELTVDQVVEHMGLGRTVFFNRLKKLTGLSPVEFIRELRIKRAAQLLEAGTYNVSEVTYMVGLNDSRYFSKCFKNTYGVTPSEYKRQHDQAKNQ